MLIIINITIIILSGTAVQRGLWPHVAFSPARAMASCGTAAQRGLWAPLVLQPSAGYGLLVHEVS
jgi:hypothetical protein